MNGNAQYEDLDLPGPPVRVAGAFLTRRCNLSCLYCGVTKRHFARELSATEWIEAFGILEAIGIRNVALLGGEPTLVDGIEDIVRWLAHSSMDFSVISNSLVPKARLRKIIDAGLERFSTSIDTVGQTRLNDGSWRKSRSGLETLLTLKEWQVSHLTAYLVLTRLNLREVPKVAEYLSVKGIWLYLLPFHWGEPGIWENRAVDPSPALSGSDLEILNSTVESLCRMKQEGARISNSLAFLKDLPRYGLDLSWHCAPSTSELRIDADGSLTCCNDRRGNVASRFTVFKLREPGTLAQFQIERSSDAASCPGCFWPGHYHAAAERFTLSHLEGAFSA